MTVPSNAIYISSNGIVYYSTNSPTEFEFVNIPNGNPDTVLTSTGLTSIPSFQPLTGSISEIDGNTGAASGSIISLISSAGSTTEFVGASSTLTFSVTDTNSNTLIGEDAGHTNTGSGNASLGKLSLGSLTSGLDSTALGNGSLSSLQSGSFNVAAGNLCLNNLVSGNFNICAGVQSGADYTTNESSNILFNNVGMAGESNVLRIGVSTGATNGSLEKAFIAGINGVTSSNPLMVTINSATDQLGVAAIPVVSSTIIKGGTFTYSGGTQTINFSPAFPTNCTSVVVSFASASSGNTSALGVVFISANSFNVQGIGADGDYYYMAMGT